jgi:uncharacterized protein DUF5343
MAIRTGGQAPYAPPQTVVGIIHTFRNRPVQPPFTPDVLMRMGVKDSLLPRVTATLKALDLIGDDLMPTPQFEGLRRAPEAEYRQRFEAVVRSAYEEVFQYFDPTTDGEEKARDIFRHYEPIGQLTRIVRLFLALCEEAGIFPQGRAKNSGATRVVSVKRPATRREPKPVEPPARRGASVSAAANVRTGDGGLVPPAIMGVLQGLPSASRGWTQRERDQFYAAFGSLLDFSIPIRAEIADDDEPDDNEAVG